LTGTQKITWLGSNMARI